MKIHQEIKIATLVQTFSIGVFFLSKIDQLINRNCVLSNGSVELPKTTHLPKTTENHLENHIYRGIKPS